MRKLIVYLPTIFLLGLLIGAYIAYSQTPTTTLYVTPGLYPGAVSFTAWREGSDYFIKSAFGGLSYSGTNISQIANAAMASAASGKLFFRSGVYVYTGALDVPSYWEVEGETIGYLGNGGVSFRLDYNGSLIQQVGTSPSHKIGFALRNVYLDGDGRSHDGDAIFLNYVSNVLIKDVYIINFKGHALYIANAFNGYVEMVKIDNCGDNTDSNPSVYLGGGVDGCADFTLNNMVNSLFNYIGLYMDIYATQIHVSNYVADQAVRPEDAVYQHMYLLGQRLEFANVDLRTANASVNIIDDHSPIVQFANVFIGNNRGIAYNRGAVGTAKLANCHFEGVNSSASGKAQNGFYIPIGSVWVSGYSYQNQVSNISVSGSGILYNANYTTIT